MQKTTIKRPSFLQKSELARYVDPDEIKDGGRVSSAAFMPLPEDAHLSVNSLELESLADIARYYRSNSKLYSGTGAVAVACRKVIEYNNAASHAGIGVRRGGTGKWEFDGPSGKQEAYKHRPILHVSSSHCGVEFIRADSNEKLMKKIARRLAGRRPHLFKM